MLWNPRILREPESDDAAPAAEPAPEPDSDKLKAEAAAAKAEAEKLRAADRKRKAEEKRKLDEASAAKAVEDGKAKDEIARLAAERDKALDEFEQLRKMEIARLDKVIESMPAEAQETVNKFREKMALADFAELVNEYSTIAKPKENTDAGGDEKPVPPPPAAAGGPVRRRDGRELDPQSVAMLRDFGIDHRIGEKLQQTDWDGGRLFGLSLHEFIDTLKAKGRAESKRERYEILEDADRTQR